MDNQLLRLVILVVLVFMLTSDIKDLMQALSTTSSVGAYFSWMKPQGDSKTVHSSSVRRTRKQSDVPNISDEVEEEDADRLQFYTPVPTGRSGSNSRKLNYDENSEEYKKLMKGRKRADSILNSLTDVEVEELTALKTHLTKVMQEWCLPKLVCELHASAGDRNTFTDAEQGLLSIIKETSMNPMGEVISRYHFAAHMGQLLADVEGNGCHNFYPNCPLSGRKVLQMVKKVRIR